jgi:hypothetical protein
MLKDKKEIRDFLKLPTATSFIRKTLYEMAVEISIEEMA